MAKDSTGETVEAFRKSFFYGSRSDLGFKFLAHLSDAQASEFFQGLLAKLGDAYDSGDAAPVFGERAVEARVDRDPPHVQVHVVLVGHADPAVHLNAILRQFDTLFADTDMAAEAVVEARRIDAVDLSLTRLLVDWYRGNGREEDGKSFLHASLQALRRVYLSDPSSETLRALHTVATWLPDADLDFIFVGLLRGFGAARWPGSA